MKERILSLVLTFVMVVSLFTGMAPVEVQAAETTTLKYEVVGGTGTMEQATLTVGEKFVLPSPEFTPADGREFYGWFVYDSADDRELEVCGYEKPAFTPKGEYTYTAIACYGYPVTVENLPEGTNITYMSKTINNPSALVIPEAGEKISEEANCFIIQNSSMTSAPIFTGENGRAELVRSDDGTYMYVVRDITGPVTLTLTDAPEVSGNIELKENVSITKLETNKYEVQGLEEEEGFTWVYNLGSVNEGQDVNEKVAFELASWLNCEKDQYVELKKVWGIDDEPYIISGDFLRKQIDDYDYVQIFKLDAQENVHEVALLALPKNAAQEVTYDITLDRTNYADGYVDLYTYDSEGNSVASTQVNNATITMPEGGKVRVFADSEFTVTAEGATISEMLSAGDEGYYYELIGITADTTVVVNKVVDEPEEGKKIYDTGTKHLYHPRYTYNEETRKFTVLLEKPQAGYEYRVFWTSFPMNPMAPYLDDLDSQYGTYFGMANKVENNSFEVGTGQIVALYYCEKDASSYNSSTVQSVIFGTENDGTIYGGEDRNGTDFKLDIDYELLSTVVENGSLIIPASSSEYTELRNTLKEAIKVPKDATYHTGLDGLYIHEYDPETKTVGAQAGYSSMQAGKKYVYVMYMFGKISANPTSNQEGVEHCKKSNVYYVWYDLSLLAAPEITGQPQDVTVEEGNTATFTVTASGKGLSYQWQVDNGNGFVDIEGATSASYTTSVVDMSYNGFKYQCIVKTSTGSATSNSATLTVTEKAKIVAPAITGQPQNATVEEGQKATFTVTATGDDLSYQWMIDRNDGKGFVNLNSTTATHTTTVVDMSCNGFKYKCIVSNSVGAVTSNVVTLTVTEKEVVHTHDLTLVPAKAATCTEEGNKAYYTCSGCDSLFTDAEGTKTTTAEAVKIAALGHDMTAATCKEPGVCKRSGCDHTVDALGHDWSGEWTIIKEATATEEGKKETYCTRKCGQKKVAVIPIEGEEDEDAGNIEKDAEVDPEAPVDEATIDNKKDELLEGDIFTEEEKELIEAGEEARVWLEIGKTDEDAIAADDKAKIEKEAADIMGDDAKITYFDADLFKQVGNGKKTEITEPGVDIKITIIIPEELLNQDKTITREYKIIRLHDGEVDVISGTFDPATGEFSFETDRFSTYAIVYDDVPVDDDDDTTDDDVDDGDKKDDVPDTGVVSTSSYVAALALISGLGFVFCASKKKSNE